MTFLLANWRLVLIGIALAIVGGYVLHCETVKDELAATVAIAEAQQRESEKKALADIKNKERTDENYTRNISRLNADIKRLRDSRSRLLPAAPANSPSPERACFDRPELGAALQRFAAGAEELIGEGAKAVEGLDAAKEWAHDPR